MNWLINGQIGKSMAMVPWIDESMLREPYGTTMELTTASSMEKENRWIDRPVELTTES